MPAFSDCVRDGLTDPSGQAGPVDTASACASLQNDQAAYYSCLCSKATSVVGCYSIFCPRDPLASSAKQSQNSYCDAAKQFQSTTTAMKTLTQSGPTSISKTPEASNPAKNSGAIFQIVPAIITFFIGLMI